MNKVYLPVTDDAIDNVFRVHIIPGQNNFELVLSFWCRVRIFSKAIGNDLGGAVADEVDVKVLHKISINSVRRANHHLGNEPKTHQSKKTF